MVPLSFYTVVTSAVYRFYYDVLPWWSLTLMSAAGLAVAGWIIYRRMTGPARRVAEIQNRIAARQRAAAQSRT